MQKRHSLRELFAASFLGRAVYAASNILVLPFFVNQLGVESVGLIGFYSTLLIIIMVVEGGLTSNVIHDLARIGGGGRKRIFLYINTYLVTFIVLAIIVSITITILSPIITNYWINYEALSNRQVETSVTLMGWVIGLNLIILLLHSIYIGREMHLWMNGLYILYSLTRTIGVYLLFLTNLIASDIVNYFILQLSIQVIYIFALLYVCYKPYGIIFLKIKPHSRIIMNAVPFSVSILMISISSAIILQYDKLFLSGNLLLEEFSIYTIAATLASVPYMFSSALHSTLFPRFSYNIQKNNIKEVEEIFGFNFLAFMGMLIIINSIAWNYSYLLIGLLFESKLVNEITIIFKILLIGSSLQALMIVPYVLQLSKKWTSISLKINLVSIPLVIVMVPITMKYWGMEGVAWVWCVYNILALFITLLYLSKRLEFINKLIKKAIGNAVYIFLISIVIIFLFSRYIQPIVSHNTQILLLSMISVVFFYLYVRYIKYTINIYVRE